MHFTNDPARFEVFKNIAALYHGIQRELEVIQQNDEMQIVQLCKVLRIPKTSGCDWPISVYQTTSKIVGS